MRAFSDLGWPAGFNPRTREDATAEIEQMKHMDAVSIHAPARMRPPSAINTSSARSAFQSTHPRGCDRDPPHGHREASRVSIHAPARMRHVLLFKRPDGLLVSIHAPARMRPALIQSCRRSIRRFNPRTREDATGNPDIQVSCCSVSIHAPARMRLWGIQQFDAAEKVSIHAPARMRPHTRINPWSYRLRFNPRTREDATHCRWCQ